MKERIQLNNPILFLNAFNAITDPVLDYRIGKFTLIYQPKLKTKYHLMIIT